MVVIQPEDSEEETHLENPPKPPSSSSLSHEATVSSNDKTTAEAEAEAEAAVASGSGDASDGFETASEREVSDDEDNERGATDDDHHQQQAEQRGQQQEQQVRVGDSFQDALNDDELKQKALAQGNDAKQEGNKLFGNGQYEEALLQYELALQVTPEIPTSVELRSICHSNRAVCFLKLGKYEDTIKECKKALELNPTYVKALVRRAEAHEKLEHYEEAVADMKKILELDPSNDQARRGIRRMEPLAAEKREKMKEEMIAKLKEMGNSVLGRFGMSIDNFKAVKDPNTGSYSISFQK